ncbi:MAG TPA: DNA repair protein RecN [Cytophagales bacterium]|nr:DNA repair protein RecN [Cytophagales bacterium]HRG10458.1 DNA repair protein RecN [Cyclobacteriaceae bacterium]
MLTHLTIKNYALIKHLELAPAGGLNVITGETGAGKSILLGAIGLLLGNRADSKALWDETEKCVTEGVFNVADYGLEKIFAEENLDYYTQAVLRREIAPTGKSRAFINDTPVTLDVMRKIGSRLMDIHSQHETLELGSKQFQLNLIDSFAGNADLRKNYSNSWSEYQKAVTAFLQLQHESTQLKKESDFVKFQLEELTKANLIEGELEKLEDELKIAEHTEEIKSNLNAALQQLSQTDFSITTSLVTVRNQLHAIASYSTTYQDLLHRIESARIELNDVASELEQAEEKVEFDPKRAEETKDRISTIYQLQHKHQTKTVAELISLRDSLQEQANKTNNLDVLLKEASTRVDKTGKQLNHDATALSQSRQKTFATLAKQLVKLLKELGIPDAALSIDHQVIEPGARGIDAIEILFSANKGMAPKPLAQVASGGEFSRVMFSIKYVMAGRTALPTLILDEIDSGISGEIAIQMGNRMKEMSARHQVIAISHLPQIAAKADSHLFVYKETKGARTVTAIKNLTPQERVTEIAKMIGGASPSALAIENARELIG